MQVSPSKRPPRGVNEATPVVAHSVASGLGAVTPFRRGGHGYLYWQVFLTEPVGQWLCAAGHSCRWSLSRSDRAVSARVAMRRA